MHVWMLRERSSETSRSQERAKYAYRVSLQSIWNCTRIWTYIKFGKFHLRVAIFHSRQSLQRAQRHIPCERRNWH